MFVFDGAGWGRWSGGLTSWCGGAGRAVDLDGARGERVISEVEFLLEDSIAGVGGFHVFCGEGNGDVEI